MQVVTKVRLFRSPFTVCYISEDVCVLPNKEHYKSLGVKSGQPHEYSIGDNTKYKALKLVANAIFLQPFVKECLNSDVYRTNVVTHLNERCGNPESQTVFLKLILEPPDLEIIDYAW